MDRFADTPSTRLEKRTRFTACNASRGPRRSAAVEDHSVRVALEQGNRMLRICWRTIFISSNHHGYDKPLKQLGVLSRQAKIRRATGASNVSD